MKRKRTNKKISSMIFDLFNVMLFLILLFLCVYPFYYVIIYSISDAGEIASKGIFLLPAGFSLETYKNIFMMNDIFQAFLISLFRTIIGTSITIVFSSMFAYIVSRDKLMFRKFIYRFMIITMYLNAGLIPWYLTMKMYGLKNTFLLYVIPTAISAFDVILVKTYIESLPKSLEEAAVIDGAGILNIFFKVIFPLSKPIVATIAVYECVGQWNSWIDNYFLVSNSHLQTLQLLLYNYLNKAQSLANLTTRSMNSETLKHMVSPMTVKMCITTIVTVPILFAYPFLQRYFVKGIMMGAIKG